MRISQERVIAAIQAVDLFSVSVKELIVLRERVALAEASKPRAQRRTARRHRAPHRSVREP